MKSGVSSRLPDFYQKTPEKRMKEIIKFTRLSASEREMCRSLNKLLPKMDALSENVVAVFPLPLSIVTNFIINKTEILIPYVCEEPSVVAGACIAAKLCRPTGGFTASADEQITTGHILISKIEDPEKSIKGILRNKVKLLKMASNFAKSSLQKHKVDVLDLYCKPAKTKRGVMLGVYIDINVYDLTGPRTVGKICNSLTNELESITGGTVRMAIHTDFAVKRLARARAVWRPKEMGVSKIFTGKEVIGGILDIMEYANEGITRACTNNKGIMNGISALATATGNDSRLLESGAHSYAARSGKYLPLTRYFKDRRGNLVGEIELPISMGIKGGVTNHPYAKIAQKIMNIKSSKGLAQVAACVGLAQNLAALRAMVTQSMEAGNEKLRRIKTVKH